MQTLILDATTKSIQAVMSGAAATTNPSFVASWADDNGTTLVEGSTDGALNGTTPVTLVAAPAAATRRVIKSIAIANIDTAPVTVTISYNDNSTLRTIAKVTLAVGDTWTNEGTYDTAGNLKVTTASPSTGLQIGSTTITSGTTTRILYDNAGVLGEYTLTGTGTVVVMATSPTLVTPVLGVATATSINGLTITATTSGVLTIANSKTLTVNDTTTIATNAITLGGGEVITFSASNALSLLTTGTSVMTFPTATDTVVTLAASQTLTNKTLTSPTIQTAPVLAAGTVLKFTVPSSDPSATGITTNEFNSGYSSTAIGDLVYLDSSATWQKADADASAATYSSMLGIALAVAASGAPVSVLLQGFVYAATPFPTFTIGAPVYMSATAGAVTQTAPVTTDSATRIIGYGVHADKMYFNPSNDWITHV